MMTGYGEKSKYDPLVITAIISSYYPTVVSAAETARVRAQAGYAVASTFTGAIVGVGLVTVLKGAHTWQVLLALVALVVWLMAAAMYMWVVGAATVRAPRAETIREDVSPDSFVAAVLDDAVDRRTETERRAHAAHRVAASAMLLTVLTIGAFVVFDPARTVKPGVIVLTPDAVSDLRSVCSTVGATMRVTAQDRAFASRLVSVRVEPGECRRQAVRLLLPDHSITGIAR